MGKKTDLIVQLKNFKKSLAGVFPVEKMLFFGSKASGKAGKWSDVDLLIVSKNFRGKRPLDRGLELYSLWNLDYPVDFLCYTPEEFEKSKTRISIVSHAIKHGVAI